MMGLVGEAAVVGNVASVPAAGRYRSACHTNARFGRMNGKIR
jgi:hypothetical protein